MKRSDGGETLEFLRDIDRSLEAEAAKGKLLLYVFGGTAAVIGYGTRRGTLDIDGYLEDKGIERKIVEIAGKGTSLAKKHGLYFQPANTELMLLEAPEWRERASEILKGKLKHLRVMVLSREDLILTKLSRYNDRDRADIQELTELGRVNVGRLIRYYKAAREYYIGDLSRLDATFNVVLRESFGRPPTAF